MKEIAKKIYAPCYYLRKENKMKTKCDHTFVISILFNKHNNYSKGYLLQCIKCRKKIHLHDSYLMKFSLTEKFLHVLFNHHKFYVDSRTDWGMPTTFTVVCICGKKDSFIAVDEVTHMDINKFKLEVRKEIYLQAKK